MCSISALESVEQKPIEAHPPLVTQSQSNAVSPTCVKEDDTHLDNAVKPRSRYPSERARGISEEYMAITKACIHDHDYYAVERRDPFPPQDHSITAPKDAPIQPDIYKAGVEIKPEIHRTNIRIRQRRIVRKSTITTGDVGAAGINTFTPTVPKKENTQQSFAIRGGNDVVKLKVPSPRPSITPFPPVDKTSRRVFEDCNTLDRCDIQTGEQFIIEYSQKTNSSADSAYNSLTVSSNSQSQYSTSRPPSGGKRSATGGISSSSSSDFSSDDCSDAEKQPTNTFTLEYCGDAESVATVLGIGEVNDEGIESGKSRQVSRSGRKIRKHVRRQDGAARAKDEQEKMQYFPAPPPSKPRKGRNFKSVPMRLRALPTSFWEEPNQTNGTTYTILPPVTPLLHQHDDGDIYDIPSVSPVDEKAMRGPSTTANCDRAAYHPIIKAGDTDLLLRLFDHVEKHDRSTAVRKKRGRSKRPEYVSMPPRRAGNQNPCIIESITEKLFPKLSLDNRQTLAALTRTLPRRTPAEIIGQDVKLSNAGTGMVNTDELLLRRSEDGINAMSDARTLSDSSPIFGGKAFAYSAASRAAQGLLSAPHRAYRRPLEGINRLRM